MRKTVLVVISFIAVGYSAMADERRQVRQNPVCFVAKENLNLRSEPPSGLFYMAGQKIGTVGKGETLIATDEKRIKTLFGEYKWVEGEVVDARTHEKKGKGWIYAGNVSGESHVEASVCTVEGEWPRGGKR